MIDRIKNIAKNHKTLIQNFSYLSALQVFNMLLPLITYPYLIRVLGAEQYGLVIFAQIIASYFGILIGFGFRMSATKEISIHRENNKKLSEIVSSVLTIKLSLWVLSLAILLTMIWFIPKLNNEKLLFIFSFAICFNELLFPQWYFQGIERMKYITIINLIARLCFLALIFIIVKQKSDYLYVPLLNGIGALIGGLLGLYVMFIRDQIQFKWQSTSVLKFYIKDSLPLFGSNAIISIKDRLNIIFIGSFLGMKEVAIYDLATKIMTLFLQPIDIVNTTIYPRSVRESSNHFLLKTTKLVFIIVLVGVIAVQPFIKPIIGFLGEKLYEAVIPTRILLVAPLIMVYSLAFGRNCLIAKGKTKIFTTGMFLTTLFYFVLVGLAYLLGWHGKIISYVFIVILVFLFELIYRYNAVKKLHII